MAKYTSFPIDKFAYISTPFYFYDMELLDATLKNISQAIPSDKFIIHYAIKANNNSKILSKIASYGFGADCVSAGEIRQAINAGFDSNKIVFAGVGKTDDEILFALKSNIGCFNIESLPELAVIDEIATNHNFKANIALRLNPNIDAHTHEYITTGLKENKFGIALEQIPQAINLINHSNNICLKGIHFHIGSQITILEPFKILCKRIKELLQLFKDNNIDIQSINVGGGLGIDYDNPDSNPIADFKNYFKCFDDNLPLLPNQKLYFELGRAIVAQCGSLISKVLYVKNGIEKNFIIIDAGMTELIRPALYQAYHKIQNISSNVTNYEIYDVVGPICESSDCFATNEKLPVTKRGDLIAIRSAGAYGQSMASTYNSRPLPKSYYSDTL